MDCSAGRGNTNRDPYQAVETPFRHPENMGVLDVADQNRNTRRMFKKAVQRGRSKRSGEAYCFSYVESLSVARTKLADFFNILLCVPGRVPVCGKTRGGWSVRY